MKTYPSLSPEGLTIAHTTEVSALCVIRELRDSLLRLSQQHVSLQHFVHQTTVHAGHDSQKESIKKRPSLHLQLCSLKVRRWPSQRMLKAGEAGAIRLDRRPSLLSRCRCRIRPSGTFSYRSTDVVSTEDRWCCL